jgi:NADPH:quinone reductase-like Zn-dependent oxidoreductase
MKAWILQGFGLENLQLREVPTPIPGSHQILVKVKATALNYRDKAIVEKKYLPHLMPSSFIVVSDAAGEVVETGSSVTRFKKGDRVISCLYQNWVDNKVQPANASMHALGGPLNGALAGYMLLEEAGAVRTPATLTDEEAATLPIAALTAWFTLFDHGNLQPGQTVVVQGTGGVSLFAIQFAKAAGAKVIALSGSEEKLLTSIKLGADHGINYKSKPDWQHEVLKLTGERGADQILDVVGGTSLNKSIEAAAPGAQVAVIGFIEDIKAEINLLPTMIFNAVKVQGILVGNREAFERMNAFIELHHIKPIIDTVYPFEDAIKAYRHLDRGALGKIVIKA